MEIDYKEIGRRMAQRRKELGLKQYQVCEMIDVNYKYISNLETGRSAPSLEVVMKLCSALKTTPDHLLLGTAADQGGIPDEVLIKKLACLSEKDRRVVNGLIDLMNENG